MGRTGYVNGTLAVREGLRAPVPAVDPRPIMTMADMGHGGMGGGHDMSPMSGASMAGLAHATTHQTPARPAMSGMAHRTPDSAGLQSGPSITAKEPVDGRTDAHTSGDGRPPYHSLQQHPTVSNTKI